MYQSYDVCIQVAGGALELDKPVKLFDMKKFQQNVARELKRAYPDRRKLECQVIMRMKMFLWQKFSLIIKRYLSSYVIHTRIICWYVPLSGIREKVH